MRLPCERFIRYRAFKGHGPKSILSFLEDLGYISTPDVMDYVTKICVECSSSDLYSETPLGTFVLDSVLNQWNLSSMWENLELAQEIIYMTDQPSMRKVLDCYILAGNTTQIIQEILKDAYEVSIRASVINTYRSIFMDTSLLTPYDLDMFLSSHYLEQDYRASIASGRLGAAYYGGEEFAYDPTSSYMQSLLGACVKLAMMVRWGGMREDSKYVKNWVDILAGIEKLLGPALTSKKFASLLEDAKVATLPLPVKEMGPGMSLGGTIGGRVLPADAQDAYNKIITLSEAKNARDLKQLAQTTTED